jgi:hypothetical protein
MTFEIARKVADAILYEGYVLYPYRASSSKNQLRWQFGVVMPQSYAPGGETSFMQTECLVEHGDRAVVDIKLRFLQVQRRSVDQLRPDGRYDPVSALEVDGNSVPAWDEGIEREVDIESVPLAALAGTERVVPFEIEAGESTESATNAEGKDVGRVVRRTRALRGRVALSAEALDIDRGLMRLRIKLENISEYDDPSPSRDTALAYAFVAAHKLLHTSDGRFVSLLEPPDWAEKWAGECDNRHTWPVLVGADGSGDVMLSSPIILYDHPHVADESPGDFFDSTEIDELLTLRVMTLTEEEKREARATDERSAAIIDRCDIMPPEVMTRLHGAVRGLKGPDLSPWDEGRPRAPVGAGDFGSEWEAFLNGGAVDPAEDSVQVGNTVVSKGSRVRLRPLRRADAHDLFLKGRIARVAAVMRDVEGGTHVAVTVEDDPAQEFHEWYGRYLYFSPDEVEPLGDE